MGTRTLRSSREAEPILTVTSTKIHKEVPKNTVVCACVVGMLTVRLLLRTFIGVETAALTFRTKQYSTSYSSHICYGKRFYNDFFSNHHTIALMNNFLKLLNCVVIETAMHT